MGAFAHEPEEEVSDSASGSKASSSAGGAALGAAGRAAADDVSADFRGALESADVEDSDFCVPLDSGDVEAAVPDASALRVPLESAVVAAGVLVPLASVAAGSTLRVPLGESGAPALALEGARVAAGAVVLAAVPGALVEARAGAFAAAGLPLWPPEAGNTGGIPKPAGVAAAFGASVAEAAFAGAVARTGAGATGGLGGLALAAGSEAPCAGFTSLGAESASEVFPLSGSSGDSNWSNPSKSSDSDS